MISASVRHWRRSRSEPAGTTQATWSRRFALQNFDPDWETGLDLTTFWLTFKSNQIVLLRCGKVASAASFNSFTFKLQTREREWSRRFLRLTLMQVLGFLVCFLLASFRFVMRDGKVIHVSKLSDSGPWSVWQVLQLLLYPIPLLLSLSWPALASPFSSVLAALLVLPPLTAPKTGQPSTRSHYVHILSPCTTSCWSSWAGVSRRRHCRCGFGGEGQEIGTQRRNSR